VWSMPKTVFSGAHVRLVAALAAARRQAQVTQAELARRLGKDQSFVSIIEGGQRRVDVIEFCAIARALEIEPRNLFDIVVSELPDDLEI
jgi:transcriptional regulator with XRE-family HTH domain